MLKKLLKWTAISWAILAVIFFTVAVFTPTDEVAEEKPAPVAEKKKEVAAKAEEDKPAPVDYEKAREETGGYLPQVELDDMIAATDLRANITKAKVTANHVAIWAGVETNLTAKMTYKSARLGAVEIYKMLSKLDDYATATIIMSAPGTDAYGNDIDMEALKVTWTKETIDKVNYDQFDFNSLGEVAEFYSTTE